MEPHNTSAIAGNRNFEQSIKQMKQLLSANGHPLQLKTFVE